MFPSFVLLVGVILPASVLSAPTVHFEDQFVDISDSARYDSDRLATEATPLQPKPHIVEPTWITVTMPPLSYNPSVHAQQPPVMTPYVAYIPVPPQHQPLPMPWPSYYPNMPVLPPYPSNHLCNQRPQNSY
uniref:VM domain-containing protein n=1 Tax=Anopheles dirus TaxID=7168 RepID=A0A182NRI7_9DIPT